MATLIGKVTGSHAYFVNFVSRRNMSWMHQDPLAEAPVGPPPVKPGTEESEGHVADPSIPNRLVSTKQANKPFLACVFLHVFFPPECHV